MIDEPILLYQFITPPYFLFIECFFVDLTQLSNGFSEGSQSPSISYSFSMSRRDSSHYDRNGLDCSSSPRKRMASDIGETHPKYFPRTEIENRDGNGNRDRDIANDKGASMRRMESFEINGSESFASQVNSTYVRMFVHVCVFVHICVFVHVCVLVHIRVFMMCSGVCCLYVHSCGRKCVCTYFCSHECTYVIFIAISFSITIVSLDLLDDND